MTDITECVYCGREMPWEAALFEAGITGEPACPRCYNENELGGDDE